uniref:Ovule protein n=1 Tax=Meloidogyne incognita TaxID=6306 RepID=A0A914KIY3_MELIC
MQGRSLWKFSCFNNFVESLVNVSQWNKCKTDQSTENCKKKFQINESSPPPHRSVLFPPSLPPK